MTAFFSKKKIHGLVRYQLSQKEKESSQAPFVFAITVR